MKYLNIQIKATTKLKKDLVYLKIKNSQIFNLN